MYGPAVANLLWLRRNKTAHTLNPGTMKTTVNVKHCSYPKKLYRKNPLHSKITTKGARLDLCKYKILRRKKGTGKTE